MSKINFKLMLHIVNWNDPNYDLEWIHNFYFYFSPIVTLLNLCNVIQQIKKLRPYNAKKILQSGAPVKCLAVSA